MISDNKLTKLDKKYSSIQKEAQAAKDPQLADLYDKLNAQLLAAKLISTNLGTAIQTVNRVSDEGLSSNPGASIQIYSDAIRRLQEVLPQFDVGKQTVPHAIQTLSQIVELLKTKK